MLKQSGRKRMNSKTTGSFTSILTRQGTEISSTTARKNVGCVAPLSDGAPKAVYFSAASSHAHDPATDSTVLQVDSRHMFAAVLTSKRTSRGGPYLRQHIHSELEAQISRHSGQVPAAMQAAIAQLEAGFRRLNPLNPSVLEGVQIALAHLDFGTRQLHLVSNGGCRCVVGKSLRGESDGFSLVAEMSHQPSVSPKQAVSGGVSLGNVSSLEVTDDIDTLVLGSTGLWNELAPQTALLRARHFFEAAPKANQGSAAAHLTNFALHRVAARLRGSPDPRMRALRDASSLLRLEPGERGQYKYGSVQPVRRRRGDVHGDLTAVVVRLDWEGRQCSFKEIAKKPRQAPGEAPGHLPQRQYSHWDLVRMHFRDFPRDASRRTREQWRDVARRLSELPPSLEPPPTPPARDLEKAASRPSLLRGKATRRLVITVAAQASAGALPPPIAAAAS